MQPQANLMEYTTATPANPLPSPIPTTPASIIETRKEIEEVGKVNVPVNAVTEGAVPIVAKDSLEDEDDDDDDDDAVFNEEGLEEMRSQVALENDLIDLYEEVDKRNKAADKERALLLESLDVINISNRQLTDSLSSLDKILSTRLSTEDLEAKIHFSNRQRPSCDAMEREFIATKAVQERYKKMIKEKRKEWKSIRKDVMYETERNKAKKNRGMSPSSI